MKIRSKLFLNLILIVLGIIIISATGFYSLRFIQSQLRHLTQKRIPEQLLTVGLNSALEAVNASLTKTSRSKDSESFLLHRVEAESAIDKLSETEKKLDDFGGEKRYVASGVRKIAEEIFLSVSGSLEADKRHNEALKRIKNLIQATDNNIKGMNSSIAALQARLRQNYSADVEKGRITLKRLEEIEALRSLLREIQILLINSVNSSKKSEILLGNAKLKFLETKILKNGFYIRNETFPLYFSPILSDIKSFFTIKASALESRDSQKISTSTNSGRAIQPRLNDLFQNLDQESILARDLVDISEKKKNESFKKLDMVNSILVDDSEFVSSGYNLSSSIERMLNLDSEEGAKSVFQHIKTDVVNISGTVERIKSKLRLNAITSENEHIDSIKKAVDDVNRELAAKAGVFDTLLSKIKSDKLSAQSEKLLEKLISSQKERLQIQLIEAQYKQKKSMLASDEVVRQSLSRIYNAGAVVVLFALVFGYWIYSSVSSPIKKILSVMASARQRVDEKAKAAGEIAQGNYDVTLNSSPIASDVNGYSSDDELGEIIRAISKISSSQELLDKAFTLMTSSLISHRDKEIADAKISEALQRLSRIFQNEEKLIDTSKVALNSLCDHIKAGAAILYLYDAEESLLKPVAGYGINLDDKAFCSVRLGEGVVGEAAASLKIMVLDNLPDHYLKVRTTLTGSVKSVITAFPLETRQGLSGAIEVATLRRLSEDDYQYLEFALYDFAVSLMAGQSTLRINTLLIQAEAQNEELTVQQEELRQSHDELLERIGKRDA